MDDILMTPKQLLPADVVEWFKAAPVGAFPENGGAAILYKEKQVAVYNFTLRGEWYATDNTCPHRKENALSRGMIGDQDGEPKVACPFHKKTFSLRSGKNLGGEDCAVSTYPVKIEQGFVFVGFDF